MQMLVQEADCRVKKGSFGLKIWFKSMEERQMIKKVCQWTQGALRVVAAVGVVMERYTNISKKCTATQKATKALLNNKMATVRVGAKVKSVVSTVPHPRQPNKQECE
jgi:tRNA isopentenyl-2-thiomethyl-A-37 hydroxylase MiaE